MKRFTILFLLTLSFTLVPNSISAQFFNRLKEKVKKEAVSLTEEIIDERVTKTEDKRNTEHGEKTKNSPSTKKNQTSNKNENDFGLTERITYKAPNSNFIDFELQSYKGLPRFGILHKEQSISPEKEIEVNYEIYSSLIELKYLKDKMDMDQLKLENLGPNSYQTINGIKRVAYLTTNDETFLKYFCNTTTESCPMPPYRLIGDTDRAPGLHGSSKNGILGHWGGNNATEFEQRRIFDTFLNDDYNTLREWSDTIWTDGYEIGYLVGNINLKRTPYDFKNQGYWLYAGLKTNESINLSNNTFSPLRIIVRYVPNQRFEKEPEASKNYVLFKISPEEAEKLEENSISKVFIVYKIKLSLYRHEKVYNKKYNKSHKLLFKYNVEDSIVELYEDEALTKKIGEVSLENGLFKD